MHVASSPFSTWCSDLDADVAVEILSRHGVNLLRSLFLMSGVASADLRRLLWSRPQPPDVMAEFEERLLDLAEKNIAEAL